MARKVSKRKKPSKEDYLLTQRWEIEDSVFDKYVLLTISKFMKKGLIKSVDFPIQRGKEANVYRATTPDGSYIAVKIYRVETTRFFKKQEYIYGDPRFKKVKKDRKNLAFAFAQKEYKNLRLCEQIGINAPKSIECARNILLMSFIGEDGEVYPVLNDVKPRKKDLDFILKEIKKMYKSNFVHSDLSAYNILVGDIPYIIDFAQGVVKGHPYFEKFLERDVLNVLQFFGKEKDFEKIIKWIKN